MSPTLHEVHVLAACELDARAHEAHLGVGTDAGKLDVLYAGGLERRRDAREKTGAHDGAAAIHQKGALGPKGRDLAPDPIRVVAAKDEAGGGLEHEVVHA